MLKFKCFIKEVAENMPLIPIREHKFKWVEEAKEFYKTANHPVKTTSCPGMFSMLNTGWIHRSYMDIRVETYKDGDSYKTMTSYDQERIAGEAGPFVGQYIDFHSSIQTQWIDFPKGSSRTMLKIQSPWFVEIPKGYSLLMMPIPYADDARFTAAHGLLKGNNYLNVQLFWNQKEGIEIIKKGTPLNQMVLIKDELDDYEIEVIEPSAVEGYLKENYAYFEQRLGPNAPFHKR
jgi:hypothetical protein